MAKIDVLKILDDRINHHKLNNEEHKDIRISEINILKLIIKDKKCQ